MSVTRCVEVKCDGRWGSAGCPDGTAWSDYGAARDLRQRMRAAGWRVNAGPSASRDVCPACQTPRSGVLDAQ
jgi:hypothetical protein